MSGREARGRRPPSGRVARLGDWVIGESGGEAFAVSRRCRHQLADLSRGTLDRDGCLVCPWHASKYDVRTGEMVRGPRGFLGYRGPTPGYGAVIRILGRVARLRRRPARVEGAEIVVSDA